MTIPHGSSSTMDRISQKNSTQASVLNEDLELRKRALGEHTKIKKLELELQILNKNWKSQNDKLIFSNQQRKDNIIKCNSYVSDDHKRQVEKWLSEVEIEQEKKEYLSRSMEKTERSIYWGVEGRQGCIWRLKSCFCLFLQNSCNRQI